MEREKAKVAVAGSINPDKVSDRVNRSCERAVEPTPSLAYELSHAFGTISFALGCLDVSEPPTGVRLGHHCRGYVSTARDRT